MNKEDRLPYDEAVRLFKYNPSTGLLTRKVRTSNSTKKGDIVGCPDRKGYLQVGVGNDVFFVHRVVWLVVHGVWPTNQVDHINRVKNDNRMENLRSVTNSQNSCNRGKPSNNTSGFVGVYKHGNKWKACITRKRVCCYLGLFLDKQQAVLARAKAERRV